MPAATLTQINGRKFELPKLAPLDSLTAGTDIPPPPDSPIEEQPPVPSKDVKPSGVSAVADGAPVNGHSNGTHTSADAYVERGRTNGVSTPLSPTSSNRPSSIRRFLSRKSLNSNYTNGTNSNASQENLHAGKHMRPESALSMASKPELRWKRSSSWFRKLTGGSSDSDRKRTSIVYEEKQAPPPPPKLPELNQFKAKVDAEQAGLGSDDMFKNIK